MKTLIVNAFGGPAAGKTTFAWEIASHLKKLSLPVEYVSEYAKELVYEERFDILDNTMKNQRLLFEEQKRRIDRLMGKVRIIVTDSPLLLAALYAKDRTPEFFNEILDEFNKYDNINFYIKRDENDVYDPIGRKETKEESIDMDNVIYKALNENNIDFEVYYRSDIGVSIDSIIMQLDDIFNLYDMFDYDYAFENPEILDKK